MKLAIKFAGVLFVEALLFALVARYTVIYDNPLILLFPGVWAFFGGVTIPSVLMFVGFTAISYLIAGFALAFVYTILQKVIPKKFAFTVSILIPIFILGAIAYSEYKSYNEFFHIGDTPADCAQLEPSQRNWCYRTIYQRYPISEVCSKLEYGEATQCWQLCKAANNENCQDAPPLPQGNVKTTIYE